MLYITTFDRFFSYLNIDRQIQVNSHKWIEKNNIHISICSVCGNSMFDIAYGKYDGSITCDEIIIKEIIE